MADDLGEVWRQAIEANTRYYSSLSQLATDYVRELSDAFGRYSATTLPRLPTITLPSFSPTVRTAGSSSTPAASGRGFAAAEASGTRAADSSSGGSGEASAGSSSAGAASVAAVVLEGAPGTTAHGAVLVENHLAHPVSAAIRATVDGDVHARVEPDHVDLAPGASTVLRVSAVIPVAGSSGDQDIRGELSAPELIGTAVPLLIRRASPPDGAGVADDAGGDADDAGGDADTTG